MSDQDDRIKRLEKEIEELEKIYKYHQRKYKSSGDAEDKANFDYHEGVHEGLATALKIIQGKLK